LYFIVTIIAHHETTISFIFIYNFKASVLYSLKAIHGNQHSELSAMNLFDVKQLSNYLNWKNSLYVRVNNQVNCNNI